MVDARSVVLGERVVVDGVQNDALLDELRENILPAALVQPRRRVRNELPAVFFPLLAVLLPLDGGKHFSASLASIMPAGRRSIATCRSGWATTRQSPWAVA